MGSGASSPANKRNDQSFFSVGVNSSKSNRSVQNTTVEYSKSLTKPSPRVSAKTHLTSESYDGGVTEKIEPEIIFSGIKLITFEKFKSHGSFPAFDDFSDNHEYFLVPLELINQDRSFIVYISYNWNVDTKPKEIYKLIIEGIQKIQAAYTSNSTKCYLYYDIDAQQNTAYKTVSFRAGDDISNSNNDLTATYNKEVAQSNTTAYNTAGYNRGISGEMSESVRIRNKSINFVVENSIQAAINNVVTSEKVSYTVVNNDTSSNTTLTTTTATATATQVTTQNVFNTPQKTSQKTTQNSTFNTPNNHNINNNTDTDSNKHNINNISVTLTSTQTQLHTLISNCDCLFTPIFDAQSSDWTLPHILTSCTEYGSKSFFNPHNNTNSNSNSINNSYNSSVNNSGNNNHLQILTSVINSNNSILNNNNTNNTTTTTTTALSTKANKIDHSYLSSAYARVEMLYALNISIKDGSKVKRHLHFTGPLSTHLHHNRRPHFVYGTKESKRFALPIILPPLKNVTLGIEKSVSETVKSSFGDFNPLYGVVESELERMQIEQMVTNILPHIQTYFKTENNESVCDYNHGGYDHNGYYKEILPSNSTSNKY